MWYFGNIEGTLGGTINVDDLDYYGFDSNQDWIWSECSCAVEEGDDEDYCHQCYDSVEEHTEANDGEPPEIVEDCTYTVCIDRDKFTEVALPWMIANEHIKRYLPSLAMRYDEPRKCIVFIQVKTLPCSDEEQEDLDVYVLLKQIEYFFQKSGEDACSFGVEVH
jgi:hypothetical protein